MGALVKRFAPEEGRSVIKNIEITNKNTENFVLIANKTKILIFPLNKIGSLNDLFDYVGEFKAQSATGVDINNNSVKIKIKKVLDYSETLKSNSEYLTVKSEDLVAGYVHGRRVVKTVLKQPYIDNLNTSVHSGRLYLKDGSEYDGCFHIHISDSTTMTGKTHEKDSETLYFKQIDRHGSVIDKLISTHNPSHIPQSPKLKIKSRIANEKASGTSRTGGGGGGGGY